MVVHIHLHGRKQLGGLTDLSDVYTHRSELNSMITLTKKLYYIGGSRQTDHGDCGSTLKFKPLTDTLDNQVKDIGNNANVYFYFPPEFGWKYNENENEYYLTKTPITILSGKEYIGNDGIWNTNGNWWSQTCQFDTDSDDDYRLNGANRYDRFLVLLEKTT